MPKFYITMGQDHAHRVNNVTIDRNIVVELEKPTELEARERAFELFGAKWSFIYKAEDFDAKDYIKYFPRGIIKLQ